MKKDMYTIKDLSNIKMLIQNNFNDETSDLMYYCKLYK